jgi:hypothetical protein
LADQDFGQSGFALTVLAHKGHPFASKQLKINIFQNLQVAVALRKPLGLGGHLAAARGFRKADAHDRSVGFVDFDAF